MKTYQLLWRLFLSNPLYAIALLLCEIIGFTFAPLALGLLMREFFDALTIENSTFTTLLLIFTLMAALATARMIFLLGRTFYHQRVNFILGTLLRKNLLKNLLDRLGARPLPDSSGECVNRFRGDIDTIVSFNLYASHFLSLLFFTLIAVVIMWQIHPLITLIIFIPIILTATIVALFKPLIRRYNRRQRESTGQVTAFIAQIFHSVETIKVASAEDAFISRFKQLNRQRRDALVKDNVITATLESCGGMLNYLGIGLIIILSAHAFRSGNFTIGEFALFTHFLAYISWGAQWVGHLLALYQHAGISMQRLLELQQDVEDHHLVEKTPTYLFGKTPPTSRLETKENNDPLQSLQIKELSYLYPDTGRGIHAINLTIHQGTFTVITGRVGSGKTTLLRTLLGQLPSHSGETHWNKTPVTTPRDFFTPPRCAYTSQLPKLFSDTLKNNLLLGLPENQETISTAIHTAALESDIARFEKGLDTLVGPRGIKLSGGQLRRAAAARMFLREADLFIFDDLSSGLDVETERQLWKRLFKKEGRTCLAVSHRHAAFQHADQIIVMKAGRIEAAGSLQELLNQSKEMQLLWESKPENA